MTLRLIKKLIDKFSISKADKKYQEKNKNVQNEETKTVDKPNNSPELEADSEDAEKTVSQRVDNVINVVNVSQESSVPDDVVPELIVDNLEEETQEEENQNALEECFNKLHISNKNLSSYREITAEESDSYEETTNNTDSSLDEEAKNEKEIATDDDDKESIKNKELKNNLLIPSDYQETFAEDTDFSDEENGSVCNERNAELVEETNRSENYEYKNLSDEKFCYYREIPVEDSLTSDDDDDDDDNQEETNVDLNSVNDAKISGKRLIDYYDDISVFKHFVCSLEKGPQKSRENKNTNRHEPYPHLNYEQTTQVVPIENENNHDFADNYVSEIMGNAIFVKTIDEFMRCYEGNDIIQNQLPNIDSQLTDISNNVQCVPSINIPQISGEPQQYTVHSSSSSYELINPLSNLSDFDLQHHLQSLPPPPNASFIPANTTQCNGVDYFNQYQYNQTNNMSSPSNNINYSPPSSLSNGQPSPCWSLVGSENYVSYAQIDNQSPYSPQCNSLSSPQSSYHGHQSSPYSPIGSVNSPASIQDNSSLFSPKPVSIESADVHKMPLNIQNLAEKRLCDWINKDNTLKTKIWIYINTQTIDKLMRILSILIKGTKPISKLNIVALYAIIVRIKKEKENDKDVGNMILKNFFLRECDQLHKFCKNNREMVRDYLLEVMENACLETTKVNNISSEGLF